MTMPKIADFTTGPVEITAERFDEMLNVLPPMKWRGGRGAQSFMMCEFTYADITDIFCEIRGRYFTLSDSCTLTHEDIMQRCALLAWPTDGTVPS
jgi:hypothetical protein